MKNIRLIIILSALYININAQSYIPFPNTDAVWTISQLTQSGLNVMKYGMYGDTVINNVSYKKIYQNYDYNFNVSNSQYKGAIREDNKKIYVYYYNDERILYDFNLNVGDTAKVTASNGFKYSAKVSAI